MRVVHVHDYVSDSVIGYNTRNVNFFRKLNLLYWNTWHLDEKHGEKPQHIFTWMILL